MSTAIIVMAKAPVAGLAKTRLIPALGADGAARLAHRLMTHTLDAVLGLQADHWELCVSPDTRHPAFEQAVKNAGERLQLTLQGDGDLGERMNRAFERVLRTHDKVLLIGTDAPALNTHLLRLAETALDRHPAVFVPAVDGGYVLVGLTRPVPLLFEAMTWSTPQVMTDTRIRARQAHLQWTELSPVHDIDEPADLIQLPGDWLMG